MLVQEAHSVHPVWECDIPDEGFLSESSHVGRTPNFDLAAFARGHDQVKVDMVVDSCQGLFMLFGFVGFYKIYLPSTGMCCILDLEHVPFS